MEYNGIKSTPLKRVMGICLRSTIQEAFESGDPYEYLRDIPDIYERDLTLKLCNNETDLILRSVYGYLFLLKYFPNTQRYFIFSLEATMVTFTVVSTPENRLAEPEYRARFLHYILKDMKQVQFLVLHYDSGNHRHSRIFKDWLDDAMTRAHEEVRNE